MTYREKFPELVVRDREVIKDTIKGILPYTTCMSDCIGKSEKVINARIEAMLSDAFLRGTRHGIDTVLDDPSAYDLFSREDGD